VASADHPDEQIVLRFEMSVESAARQAGRQHDVVDGRSGQAA